MKEVFTPQVSLIPCMPLRYLPVEIQATTLKLCAHQNRPQLPSSWPWVFSASQPVCVSATPVSRSALLSHSKHASHVRALFRHRPRRQQPPVRLGGDRGPGCTACNIMAGILIFLPPLHVNVSPDGYRCLHSTGFDSSRGCCNCNKCIWCQVSLHHVPLLFSQLCLLSLLFPNDEIPHNVSPQLVVFWHENTLVKEFHHHVTSLCTEGERISYFFSLDMPWLQPPLFSLCGFRPDHRLGSRPARSSDHTLGGNENTPKPFSVFFQVACSAELLHVMLWLGGILFLSHVVVGCFLLPPLQTLKSDPVPWNHNVIYTWLVGLIIWLVFLFAT